jgi:hypothetical protein
MGTYVVVREPQVDTATRISNVVHRVAECRPENRRNHREPRRLTALGGPLLLLSGILQCDKDQFDFPSWLWASVPFSI